MTRLVNREKELEEDKPGNGSADRQARGAAGVSRESRTPAHAGSHSSDPFDLSITRLRILRQLTEPTPSESVKIFKKKQKDGTETNACAQLTAQDAVGGGCRGFVAFSGQWFSTAFLRLSPQLVLSSFTTALRVPSAPIDACLTKLADKNSRS